MTIDRSRFRYPLFVAVISLVGFVMIGGNAFAAQGDTTRVSVDSTGDGANNQSEQAAISDDGRYIAFHSRANDLVADDTNGSQDVFVHDRDTGDTTRVTVDSSGAQANGWSEFPAISGDGRYVTFHSAANNLVTDDTNNAYDVFIHDRDTGDTTRLSVDSAGNQATDGSFNPAISGDGRYVTFGSLATNLVAGDTNGGYDMFVHDRDTGDTTRVSVDSGGSETNGSSFYSVISDDGRYVGFQSDADNLVANDTNGFSDVFVHDRDTGDTTRVSVDSDGIEANGSTQVPAISGDGRYVTFHTEADNLVTGDTNTLQDVFVHDRDTGDTTRVSVDSSGTQASGGGSTDPTISGDGRYVTFSSWADNLVSGDTNTTNDVFVHDRDASVTTRTSVDSAGVQTNGASLYPAISADGLHVAFHSWATDLVTGDTNATQDVFVHQYGADPVVTTTTTEPVTTTTTEPVTTTTTEPVTTTTTEPVTTTTTEPPATTTTTQPSVVAPGDAFTDDDSSVFEDDINTIATAGITMGCNPPANDRFCPNDYLSRGQMAAFLNRALDLTPSNTDWFTDDNTSIFQTDINSAASADITRGCNPPLNDQFCPDDHLTRGQMAAFLKRAFDLASSGIEWFTADNTGPFQADINATAAAGITRGCNPPVNDEYCADDYLTRGQMAAFLNRAITHHNDRSTTG